MNKQKCYCNSNLNSSQKIQCFISNQETQSWNWPLELTLKFCICQNSVKLYAMELYGIKLHIFCTLTGGFILHRNDKWPNILKSTVFLIIFGFFYIILAFDFSYFIRLLLAGLVAIFILIIELIVVWFNSMLDESVAVSSSSDDSEEELPSIPAGISGPLWEARGILFNERIPLDDRAYQLVRKGFDVDEVFRLIELINDGTVTKDTKDRLPTRHVKTNLIVLCGQVINIHFDRDSLSRTFTRPANYWHLVSSVLLTLFLAAFVSETRPMNPTSIIWYLSLICASAIFSLLLPPPSDPYATSFSDPFISYTRAASAVGMTGVVALMHLLENILPETTPIPQLMITIHWMPILSYVATFGNYLFRFYPFLIFVGLMGHPITTLHWLLETINKYIFGINGSPSFRKAALDFLWSALLVLGVSIFMLIGNHPITVGIAILVVTFFTQFSIADNCQTFMKKHLVTAVIAAAVSASTSLLNWVINDTFMNLVLNIIAIVHFVIDVLFPYMTTHQMYGVIYGRLIPVNFLTKYCHFITNFVTAPAFISFALINDKKLFETVNNRYFFAPFSAILILHGLRIAQTLPHIFCFAVAMTMVFFQYDLNIPATSFSLLLSLLLARKLIKVCRTCRLWFKWRRLPSGIFDDPYVNPLKFLRSTFLSHILCLLPQPLSGFSFLSFLWSIITGAPMAILNGYEMLFTIFPPRPNLFYDIIPTSFTHDEYIKATAEHPLEAPIYFSLAKSLEENLGRMVKDGELGLITDDTFFLMVSGDLMAIVHIIAVEANKISFQLRGLEYVSQTLCHGGELSKLQQIIQEHTNFLNFGHAVAFTFSMFELRVLDSPLDVVSMTQFDFVESILPAVGRMALAWELKSLVYCVLRCFHENLNPPEAPEGHYDGIVPRLSENHLNFVRFIAEKYEIEMTEFLMQRLWVIIHSIHTIIVSRGGKMNAEKIFELFDGKTELEEIAKPEEAILLKSFRFSISIIFMVGVGMAPETDDFEELFQFFEEMYTTYKALPLRSNDIENVLRDGNDQVISMISDNDSYYIIRFSKTSLKWTFFQMESESIRGFWSNEIRSILFFAMSSRERNSIQYNVQSLRNITNQSCNQPVGYPAFVTNIIDSYSEKDF
ncbi:hypothetical protein TRFO_30941 [Tritrichomonas foetus]|uniref:Pecanex C-terminal domain-containing protein n=1 Tax=Tritrichomonas foetus TaxID=1144522 RepID=A0A1J4JXR5_9EUKA|nr:hypothetical protein TRFO_30941 [Tritrichomonas foetus]|eukprot:OHT02061.1 hypothetical protein TRFO_30941 [Tritrichomonas foetus]